MHEKNAFSVALVSGDLFEHPSRITTEGEEALNNLLAGEIPIPLPTYFSIAKHGLPATVQKRLETHNDELCSNLYFLGKRSVIKTSDGLRLVALGGTFDPDIDKSSSKDQYLPRYGLHDATSLQGAHTAHVLMTSQWPHAVRNRSNIGHLEGVKDPPGVECIASLCAKIEPRYHITNSPEFFFEREPFSHSSGEQSADPSAITRFISLADYGNDGKQKWLYAFSIDLAMAQPTAKVSGLTSSPFQALIRSKRKLEDGSASHVRFAHGEAGHSNHSRSKKAKNKGPPPGPESCFFCLSNPNLQTQLITSIGNDSYLTIAKGPLPTTNSSKGLGFPGHMLIIPLSHSPRLVDINPLDVRNASFKEMSMYRKTLQSLIADKSEGKLGAVTWELNRAEGVHLHWQLLPVSAELIDNGLVEAGFRVEAETERYQQFQNKDVADGADLENDYLRIWLWNLKGEQDAPDAVKSLVLDIERDSRFDLQFPRRVMAKLLGLEERVRWQDCKQTEDEELLDAEAFKLAFKQFDFT